MHRRLSRTASVAAVGAGIAALVLSTSCREGAPSQAAERSDSGSLAGRVQDLEEDLDLDLDLPSERLAPRAGGSLPASAADPVRQRAHSEPASRPPQVAAGGSTVAVPEVAPVTVSAGGPTRSALERRVQAAIHDGIAAARKASKGRVDASNVTVAVVVREPDNPRPLVSIHPDEPLIPASNLKVLTVAAALALQGIDAWFETPFEAHGRVGEGRLVGDLVARAGGDPLYTLDSGGSIEGWLDALAAALEAAGIRTVTGQLVLDDSRWESPGAPEGWPSASDHWQAYCALSGGFTANAGCLTATVTPTKAGANARVALFPLDVGLDRRIGVKTGPRHSGNDVRVGATRSAATVRGSLGEGDPVVCVDFAHPSPIDLFGSAVVGGLQRRGMTLDGGYTRAARDGAGAGAEAGTGAEVARIRSPLRATLVPILRDSNNPVADQLYFATGFHHSGRGDRQAGAKALAAGLRQLGVDVTGLVTIDGSGLSKSNRCTAAQLAATLDAVARALPERPGGTDSRTAGAEFRAALPIGGETSKLANRMRGTAAQGRVRAKTGFVNGASSLSGYADTQDGDQLAFSILVNYPTVSGLNNAAWKPMQDAICELLVESKSQ
ncbi:MAG: D-alanyl-D-alanine carboxypeptidase/D-alanyl-D-alanine-endopeptidase [Planctomycetota bacterium]